MAFLSPFLSRNIARPAFCLCANSSRKNLYGISFILPLALPAGMLGWMSLENAKEQCERDVLFFTPCGLMPGIVLESGLGSTRPRELLAQRRRLALDAVADMSQIISTDWASSRTCSLSDTSPECRGQRASILECALAMPGHCFVRYIVGPVQASAAARCAVVGILAPCRPGGERFGWRFPAAFPGCRFPPGSAMSWMCAFARRAKRTARLRRRSIHNLWVSNSNPSCL